MDQAARSSAAYGVSGFAYNGTAPQVHLIQPVNQYLGIGLRYASHSFNVCSSFSQDSVPLSVVVGTVLTGGEGGSGLRREIPIAVSDIVGLAGLDDRSNHI